MKPSSINLAEIKLYGVLDANSFQKLFPQEYINKFASHLRVLQFEKNLFQKPIESGKLKFVKRSSLSQSLQQDKNKEKTNLSKFAKVNDTILNDRAQIARLKSFAKQISQNLNNTELKSKLLKQKFSNDIKILQNKEDVQMNVIETMLVDSTRQTNEKINHQLQNIKNKQIFCKFIKRENKNDGKNSYKSRMEWDSMKRYNSETKIKNYLKPKQSQQFSHKLPQKSTSNFQISTQKQIFSRKSLQKQQKNVQLKERCTSLNQPCKNLVRNRIKSCTKVINNQRLLEKVDLIQETKKIRQSKKLLKSILYTEEINKKKIQKTFQKHL